MRTKLVPVGGAHGIAIDDKLLAELGFTPDMELELTVDDGCLVVSQMGAVRRPAVPAVSWPQPDDVPDEPMLGFPKKQPW